MNHLLNAAFAAKRRPITRERITNTNVSRSVLHGDCEKIEAMQKLESLVGNRAQLICNESAKDSAQPVWVHQSFNKLGA